MARQNGSGLLKQSGRGIRILADLRQPRYGQPISGSSKFGSSTPRRIGEAINKQWQLGRQSNGPAVVVRSTSPQLCPGLALLTRDASRRRRAIDGLPRSGIVEIHTIHLARKCAYSRREAKTVSARDLHGRKFIEYAEGSLVAAERDGPQLKRQRRYVGCSARSGTSERASLSTGTRILPLERDL